MLQLFMQLDGIDAFLQSSMSKKCSIHFIMAYMFHTKKQNRLYKLEWFNGLERQCAYRETSP